jgi:hypothetical protein
MAPGRDERTLLKIITPVIILVMARGWESKSVEAQQEARERREVRPTALSPDEAARESRRRTLSLARSRALADLQKASNPAHRAMLEAALKALDDQLNSDAQDSYR